MGEKKEGEEKKKKKERKKMSKNKWLNQMITTVALLHAVLLCETNFCYIHHYIHIYTITMWRKTWDVNLMVLRPDLVLREIQCTHGLTICCHTLTSEHQTGKQLLCFTSSTAIACRIRGNEPWPICGLEVKASVVCSANPTPNSWITVWDSQWPTWQVQPAIKGNISPSI